MVGFELMDNARFGQTQFQERLTFQRGLEGELTRSILALGSVAAARVHLALPNQNGFFREQQKPSASVLLTLHPGRSLDRAQVAGIVHLVSSSVPELNTKAVSVIDQTGALLSGSADAATGQGLDAQQLQYVQQVEQSYLKRVTDLLEPVVGRDNLRATVTAEIDFSQTEATSELFKPNQGAEPAAVRSSQKLRIQQHAGRRAAGVPGAASNQPPTPPTAQINGPAGALQGAQGSDGRQPAARERHELRDRQDRARHAQRHRHRQAPERGGGGEPPRRARRQGQGHEHPAVPRGAGEADRAGAGEHRLQQGARRLGEGHQRPVPQRARPAGRKRAAVEAGGGAGHDCASAPCRAPSRWWPWPSCSA